MLNTLVEWRRKWLVGSQWMDADVEELYQDLHDIHSHVGLSYYFIVDGIYIHILFGRFGLQRSLFVVVQLNI